MNMNFKRQLIHRKSQLFFAEKYCKILYYENSAYPVLQGINMDVKESPIRVIYHENERSSMRIC